jgi:hypothetical protein
VLSKYLLCLNNTPTTLGLAFFKLGFVFLKIKGRELFVVVHSLNLSISETEAGGLQVRGQPHQILRPCLKTKKQTKIQERGGVFDIY